MTAQDMDSGPAGEASECPPKPWPGGGLKHGVAGRPVPQPGIICGADEAAGFVGVTPKALREKAYARQVPHRRVGASIGFAAEDIAEIIASAYVPAAQQAARRGRVARRAVTPAAGGGITARPVVPRRKAAGPP